MTAVAPTPTDAITMVHVQLDWLVFGTCTVMLRGGVGGGTATLTGTAEVFTLLSNNALMTLAVVDCSDEVEPPSAFFWLAYAAPPIKVTPKPSRKRETDATAAVIC